MPKWQFRKDQGPLRLRSLYSGQKKGQLVR